MVQAARVIFGVGTDVVEIARIEQALERFGERFARRILCAPELKRFRGHRQPALPRQALRGEGGVHQGARHRHPRAGQLARRLGAQPAFGQAGARVFRGSQDTARNREDPALPPFPRRRARRRGRHGDPRIFSGQVVSTAAKSKAAARPGGDRRRRNRAHRRRPRAPAPSRGRRRDPLRAQLRESGATIKS